MPENRLALIVSMTTGLRINDVLNIKSADLHRDRFTVREQKTGKNRRIRLDTRLRDDLLRYAGRIYVFENRLDYKRPNMTFSDTYKVKGDKHPIKLQTLRRRGKSPQDSDVKEVYNVSDYNLGFSTAIKLTGNGFDEAYEELSESVSRVAYYMTKYCTKDLEKIFGSYYIAVGKLQREMPYIICNLDIEDLKRCGRVVDLPDNLGQICYATITKDDLEGVLRNNE